MVAVYYCVGISGFANIGYHRAEITYEEDNCII